MSTELMNEATPLACKTEYAEDNAPAALNKKRSSHYDATLARGIFAQAWPVLVGQLAIMSYGVTDTIMSGHSSPADLAAMALGGSIYGSIFVGLMGVIIALNPVVAQHYGAGRHQDIGKTWAQGLWLAFILTLIGEAVLAFPDVWLVMSGDVQQEVHDKMAAYLHALGFALPAALLFRTVYALNTALSRPKVVMAINLIGLCIKVPLNNVLIFGKFGLPAFGVVGCGIATAIIMWVSAGLGIALLWLDSYYERYEIRLAWPHWPRLKELLKLGIPTGLSYIVEVTSFTFMALLIAKLGTSVTGAHQIAANLAAVCFMLPMSLSVATSTLAAQAIGAHDSLRARSTVRTGFVLALVCGAGLAGLILVGRKEIVAAYTSDPAVRAVAESLVLFLVGFHVFDALQAMGGAVLRAYKHAIAPMLVYTVLLWGVGLVGGYFVAFYPVFGAPMGAAGLWGSSIVSLFLAALILGIYTNHVVHQPLAGAGSKA